MAAEGDNPMTDSPLTLSRDDYIAAAVASAFPPGGDELARAFPLGTGAGRAGRHSPLDRDLDRLAAIRRQAGRAWDRARKAEGRPAKAMPAKAAPAPLDLGGVATTRLRELAERGAQRLASLLALREQYPGDRSLNPEIATLRRRLGEVGAELTRRERPHGEDAA